MKERRLTETESLELITQMIRNTHRRLAINAGRPFLIWGYITVIVSLFVYFTIVMNWPQYLLFAWWLIPLLGFPTMLITCRRKPTEPKNYIDRAIDRTWITCSVAMFPAFAIALGYHMTVLPLVTLIISIGTLITGHLIKSKAIVWGGILFMAGSILMSLYHAWADSHSAWLITNDKTSLLYGEIIIFALLFAIGMIIPGHILNAKTRHDA